MKALPAKKTSYKHLLNYQKENKSLLEPKRLLNFYSPCPVLLLWVSLALFMINPGIVSLLSVIFCFHITLTRLMTDKSVSPVLSLKLDINSELSTIGGGRWISIQISHYYFTFNMFTADLESSHSN